MTTHGDDVIAIARAVAGGAAVSDDELMALSASTDILALAMLADDARRARHGEAVTYVRVADVRLPLAPGALTMPPAAREIRVMPASGTIDDHVAALRTVVQAAGSTPVTAYSLAELETVARTTGRPLTQIGGMLRDCGVVAVAEAPLDQLAGPEAAFEAMRACGIEIARVTVARNTDAPGRVGILRRLGAVHRATGGVRSFAPLARTWSSSTPSTGYEDVRHVAVARLFAADVPTIQVDWFLYGPKLAQVALTMGADDLDGVSSADETPDGRRRAPLEEVLRNVRAAALTPVERDGRYRRIGA